VFEHLSDKFGLGPYVLVEMAKSFAGHIGVPKSGFEVYVEPVKYYIVVPKVIKQVDQVSSIKIKEYIETPPYPHKVNDKGIANRARYLCTPEAH
jgi:hypothetical protein